MSDISSLFGILCFPNQMILIVTITSETRNNSTLYDDIQAIADAKDIINELS